MNIYLVCEGPPDGLDVRVLNLVIAQKLGRDVLIEPAGGDRSLGSVADYLEKRYGARACVIEDRNFRSLEEAERTWNQSKQRRWIWRRHEIENYLLDPRLVTEAFRSLQASGVRRADRLLDLNDEQSVAVLLQELAQPMIENHAGWLTYGRLVSHKRDTADTRLRRPAGSLPHSPGSLYPGRAEWLAYLRSECRRLEDACEQVNRDQDLSDPAITATCDEILSRLAHPDFLTGGQFLIDLGGHELMSALCSRVNRSGVSHLSCADLQTELVEALDRLYRPGFFDPDDFAQLAEMLI